MYKSLYLLMICLLILGCTYESTPIQVKDRINFGNYSISPPRGYWYFPRNYPDKFSASKDLFLITFWEDKAAASGKIAPDSVKVFFNFSVTINRYKKFDSYYKASESLGIKYDALPSEANTLKSISNWSCKETTQSLYGIECISLGEDLVTVGVYGSNKANVLTKMQALKQMIDSIERKQTTEGTKK